MEAITRAADVALPQEAVTLTGLRTKDGAPVVVLCEFVDEEVVLATMGGIAGAPDPHAEKDEDTALRVLQILREKSIPLIEAGTALLGEDGSEIRPAFWFTKPVPGAIAGRFLTLSDRSLMLGTILRLSGHTGGPADALSFPADGERGGDGGGAVGAGEGNGGAAPPGDGVDGAAAAAGGDPIS